MFIKQKEVIVVARPQIYDVNELIDKLNDFIDSEDDPLIEKFCLPRDMPSDTYLFDIAKREQEKGDNTLSETIKRAITKQRIYLLSGKSHETIKDIFRLKQPQHGYTDKQQIDANVTGDLTINITVDDDK